MSENAAVDMLIREHRVILQVVEGLKNVAHAILDGEPADPTLLRDAISFMRDYADRFHHAKEENLLFPSLVGHGVPLHGCPIDALLSEHRRGRELVSALATELENYTVGDPGAGPAIVSTIDAMFDLYTNHIWKEDEMVFPMVERLLPIEERARLDERCTAVAETFPPDMQTHCEDFARHFTAAVVKR